MAVSPRSHWIVVDTETSGLSPRTDRVLSLACVLLDPDLRVVGTFSTLLDPGVDPGPVEVHGLTREVLAGSPRFEDVAGELSMMVAGRVLVAHNASFDWGFLQAEAARVGLELGASAVLDTVRLARDLDLGLPSLSLASLASHYQVQQTHAHDALDDTQVLVQVFRELHARALLRQTPLRTLGERGSYRTTAKKGRCAYPNPGRWRRGSVLVQGMRVAFSGDLEPTREDLEAQTLAAGLDVSGSVSGRTSLLVCDGTSGTKHTRAVALGCPVVTGAEYAALLTSVRAASGS